MRSELSQLSTQFLERLKKIVPLGLQNDVGDGLIKRRPTTFRINSLKATEEEVLKELWKIGIPCAPVSGIRNAYLLKKESPKKLQSSKAFNEGKIYLQSLSSQIPALILNPQPGEKILDMAAAPGGKTTQMAAMMKNKGEIVALEHHPLRFEKLVFNVKRQGAHIVQPFKMRGEAWKEEEAFDRILLDAPCSSEGTFSIRDRKTHAHWSLDFVCQMALRQKRLLSSAVRFLKPGGLLLYSTCALSPEENEEVIDKVLQEFPSFEVLPIPFKFPFLRSPLSCWEGKYFDPRLQKARRIYPSFLMEGFFVCLFKKNSACALSHEMNPLS